jgi:quercetin dioxygenase-like cupin family protein
MSDQSATDSTDLERHRTSITPILIQRQLPSNLPSVTFALTTHDSTSQSAIFYRPSADMAPSLSRWHDPIDDDSMAFYTLYHTTSVPGNQDRDLHNHEQIMTSIPEGPPIVVPNGTVCRLVDFAPGYVTADHRTLSIDYGVVIEGCIELSLDSGETTRLDRGCMAVQRGTMHQWRNPSATDWARVFFVLISAEAVMVGGLKLPQDLGGL